MEYILQLEKQQKYKLFWSVIAMTVLLFLFSVLFLGFNGVLLYAFLLFLTVITPLFLGRYAFFIILWVLFVSYFDLFKQIKVGGTNPINFAIAAFSTPFTIILVYKKFHEVVKELPYVKYLMLFALIVFLNFFRYGTSLNSFVEIFKYFIALLMVFCTYSYLKTNPAENIFKWINIFMITNCFAAFFQRLTGFGLMIVEGVPRIQGFLGHPNSLAFAINIFLPVATYQFINAKTKQQKILWGFSIVINLLTLLLTFCKIGYIALLFCLLVLFLYVPVKIKKRMFFSGIALFVLIILINYLFNLQIVESIINRTANNDSFIWRLTVWKLLIAHLNPSSYLLGNGIYSASNYMATMPLLGNQFIHNVYIQYFYEYGILSIFFFLIFLNPAIKFIKAVFVYKVKDRKTYIFPLLIIAQVFINCLTDHSILAKTILFITLIAITIFYMQLNDELKANSLTKTK